MGQTGRCLSGRLHEHRASLSSSLSGQMRFAAPGAVAPRSSAAGLKYWDHSGEGWQGKSLRRTTSGEEAVDV